MKHGYETSLVKRVVDALVTGIVEGAYNDEILPPQLILAKNHGVSRTIMREALSILISRRMLDVRPKRGTLIRPAKDWLIIDHEVAEWRLRATPDPEFLSGLVEFRTLVDPRAALLAATRASRLQRAAIHSAYDEMVGATARSATRRLATEALHVSIVDASGDEFLRQMASIVRSGLRAIDAGINLHDASDDREPWHYEQVVHAIDRSDAEGARAAMMSLLTDAAARQRSANLNASTNAGVGIANECAR